MARRSTRLPVGNGDLPGLQRLAVCFCFLIATECVSAETHYLLGAGLSADDDHGLGVTAMLDYGFTDQTSASLMLTYTEASAIPETISTRSWNLGLNHDFGLLGVDLSVGQWGDRDHFGSDDYSAGVYFRRGRWYASASLLSRDIDLTLRATISDQVFERTLNTSATGYGAALRYTAEQGNSYFLSGRYYNYDADVTRLDEFEVLRRLSPTAVTLSGALLDSALSAGVEFPIAERFLNLTLSRDATATDEVNVDSIVVGLLNPLGGAMDMEISAGYSDIEDSGGSAFVGILSFYYGQR
jgi:hypothetical protein